MKRKLKLEFDVFDINDFGIKDFNSPCVFITKAGNYYDGRMRFHDNKLNCFIEDDKILSTDIIEFYMFKD